MPTYGDKKIQAKGAIPTSSHFRKIDINGVIQTEKSCLHFQL